MNKIWSKNVNVYNGAINSYIKMPSSSKIRGTLLAVNENRVKISIGNEKALDIVLDKPFEGEVGDSVIIDRQNIVESKLVNSEDLDLEEEAIEASEDKYAYILKSCDIPVKEESIEAVETLENYGVDMTKENILSFMYSKEQLSNISEKLDYDTAVKLIEKDVDFEKESLQKVLQEMQTVQGEKRPFSLLRFLGIKKDMSTEEAEKIAYNLYGNKMGKDIRDVIKALDKAGLETSKSNIEEINNVFSKLYNIKNIEDKTIVDSVKNKIETSIDNLYKLKNAVVKGSIKVEEKIGQLASKVYGSYGGGRASPVTEKQLSNLEGDIRSRLENMGIKVTEELIRLSKDVIVKGLDLTKENLEKVIEVKGAIVELTSNLDYEKTALLMASGVAVDKVDVAELANMINVEEYIIENAAVEENISVGIDRLEILELIESIDIKTLALHTKFDLPNTLESLNASQELLDGKITVDTWLSIIGEELGVDYKPVTDVGYSIPIMEEIDLPSVPVTESLASQEATSIENQAIELPQTQVAESPKLSAVEQQKILDQQVAEQQALGQQVQEQQIAEQQVADQQIPDQQVADQQIPDQQVAGQQALEQQIPEQILENRITNSANNLSSYQREYEIKTEGQPNIEVNVPVNETENQTTIATQANLLEQLSIDKAELLATLNSLTSDETMEVDRQAQIYLRSNVDRLGPIMEENYKGDMAKAIIQSRIALNRNNMQDIYMLKRILDNTVDNLTSNLLEKVAEEGTAIEKLNLNELSDLITSLERKGLGQDIKTENIAKSMESEIQSKERESILRDMEGLTSPTSIRGNENTEQIRVEENVLANNENVIEIVDKMKDVVDVLKQISPERKNTIISLLMKNSIPMTLKQVQNLSFFLSNQRQIGHQLDEILNLIDKNKDREIVKIAEELKNAVNKINGHIKEGRQIGEKPYQEFARLLKDLESKSTALSREDKGVIQKSGEKLLDSLELQLQLNREDTLLQLPLMMSDQLKNLQIYIMRDKKASKKIDPRNMSVLLNFDTNNMGNVNIYLAVNYKNIVMKMGLSNKEDQYLVEKYSKELEEHLEELGYDLKNLSFRIDDDNHILSMVEETEDSNKGIKKLLDVRI